jgi:hypothetical protein
VFITEIGLIPTLSPEAQAQQTKKLEYEALYTSKAVEAALFPGVTKDLELPHSIRPRTIYSQVFDTWELPVSFISETSKIYFDIMFCMDHYRKKLKPSGYP